MNINKYIIPLFFIASFFSFNNPLFGQDTSKNDTKTDTALVNLEKRAEELARQVEILVDSIGKKVDRDLKPKISEAFEVVIEEIQREIEDLQAEIEKKTARSKDESSDEENDSEEESKGSWVEALEGIDISFKKKKEKLSDVKTRWLLVDLGFASYASDGNLPVIDGVYPLEMSLMKSISWRLHILNQRINIIGHRQNFIYGVGFTFNSFGFSNPVTLLPSTNEVNFAIGGPENRSYDKNKLRATYLHIPIMLNLETNPYKKGSSLHLNAGFYGDILIKGKAVQKINKSKNKVKDDFNLNNFQYGLLGQVGYGPMTFYGTYGLNGLFKENKDNGYKVKPITVGVKIIPF